MSYPLVDGPGIALLVAFPPFLAFMALPVFDMLVRITPENALSPIALLIIPFSLPLVISFTLTIGYTLLFLGRVLSASAWGQEDHPRFPVWDRLEILEELARWTWASLMGLAVGGLPAILFWRNCGEVDAFDCLALAFFALAGLTYAPMAMMTALLHDSIAAANPVAVIRSIARVGKAYIIPCLITTITITIALMAWTLVLLHSPSMGLGLLGLWACWVSTLYSAMMIIRIWGTLYHKNEAQLAWFRTSKG